MKKECSICVANTVSKFPVQSLHFHKKKVFFNKQIMIMIIIIDIA